MLEDLFCAFGVLSRRFVVEHHVHVSSNPLDAFRKKSRKSSDTAHDPYSRIAFELRFARKKHSLLAGGAMGSLSNFATSSFVCGSQLVLTRH